MTKDDFETMNIDELRRYVLTNREDIGAFHIYIDRSKSSGRMITIDPSEPDWENTLEQKIQQATSDGQA